MDHLRVSYQHSFTADSDALRLTATGKQRITVDGFSGESIRVFDVTAPDSPSELLGQIEQRKTGYAT